MLNANLAKLLAERASEAGWYDKPAYYSPHVVTHGQIHDSGARLEKFCEHRGISGRSRPAVPPGFAGTSELLLACLARGFWRSLRIRNFHPEDHAFQERDTEPALIVTSGALRDRFQRSRVVEAGELLSEAGRVEPETTNL